jgi:hypothetical protein
LVQVALEINPPINYVEAMRDFGWKIKFQHLRPLTSLEKDELIPIGEIKLFGMQSQIKPNGGVTVCSAKKVIDGSVIEVRAEAHCNKSDKYQRKVGNALASKRLWEFLHD